jgi:hypothetical protein
MDSNYKLSKMLVLYSAWAVVLGAAFSLFFVPTEEIQISSLSMGLVGLVILKIANLIYPLAILQLVIKTKNYSFLKHPIHFIALPLCLFMWVGPFLI